MLGLEVSLNLEVSGTFILLNTTLVPASLSFSWFHFRPWGHSPFRTLSPATHLLSYTHESHSVRAASRGKRATGSVSPFVGHTWARLGRQVATEPRGSSMMGGHECLGLGSFGGISLQHLQSWCLHSQHGGCGAVCSQQTASAPRNHLRKTTGANGEGQVRSHQPRFESRQPGIKGGAHCPMLADTPAPTSA